MFNQDVLDNEFENTKNFLLGITKTKYTIDTLMFRKGFEKDSNLTNDEKIQLVEYIKENMIKTDESYRITKKFIDSSEISSEYYRGYTKDFKGAYYPVVIKTFAGIMALELEKIKGGNNE